MTIVSATDNTNTTVTDTDTITSAADVTTDNTGIIEENDNTINYEKNEVNSISKEKSIVKQDTVNKNTKEATQVDVSSYSQLVRAVKNFNSSTVDTYTINLLPGNYNATAIISWENQNSTRLIINGNGLVLDGGNRYRFIYVTNSILEINNITLTNYNYGTGSVICNVYGNVTVKDSNFINNSGYHGSAIYNLKNCNVINCTFINNSVKHLGTIYNGMATLNVIDSTFENNNASEYGAGIYNRGNLNVTHSHFTNNTAEYGAGICADGGNLYVTTSDFTNNTATEAGGSIISWNSTYNISNSVFIGNTPDNFIILDRKVTLYYFENIISLDSTISLYLNDRHVYTGRLENGQLDYIVPEGQKIRLVVTGDNPGIFSNNTFDVSDKIYCTNYDQIVSAVQAAKTSNEDVVINLYPSDFKATASMTWGSSTGSSRKITIKGILLETLDGKATYSFMTVDPGYTLVLENIVLKNFTGEYGGAINNRGTLIVDNSTFIANYASMHGGAIFSQDSSNATVNNSVFRNNHASSNGGAIHGKSLGTITVNESYFYNNDASLGGAILVNNQYCTVNDCYFTGNTATDGGVIYTYDTADVTVTNSEFINNQATTGGGAINIQTGGIININGSVFSGNRATAAYGYGGAINNHGTVIVDNSSFDENSATIHGGAIFSESQASNLIVTDSVFRNNHATQNGGAIHNKDYSNLTVNESYFNNNSASLGGAILANNVKASINDCNFTNNYATVENDPYGGGGAIYTYSTADVTLTSSEFTNNNAAQKGGAINVQPNGIFTISNSTFNANSAAFDGGAIYNYGGDVTVSTSDFNNNTVEYSGGAIYNYGVNEMTKLIITDSNFIENTAQFVGGALVNIYNAKLNITNSNFTRNNAVNDAGAIYNLDSSTSVINSKFTENTAKRSGGAIYNNQNLNLIGSTFINNTAVNGGGVYNYEGSVIDVSNSIFIANMPENFVESNNTIYLLNTDEYIPENAVVNLNAENRIVTRNMVNRIVQDYNIPGGKYNLSITVNPDDSESAVRNTTYIIAIDHKYQTNIEYNTISDCKYKDKVNITGKVTGSNGKALKNINVIITINAKLYKAKTDSNGTFLLTSTATAIGVNNVTIGYAGNAYYEKYETFTTFNVEKQDITITYNPIQGAKYKDTVTITGNVIDANSNALKNINTIITVNGKVSKAKTDSNGAFTLNITAATVGTNNLKLSYGGSALYNGYETNTPFNVEKQDISITYETIEDVKYKENVIISGRIVGANGNGLGNVNALIHINGKLYKAKTDSTGAFTLTVAANKTGTNTVTLSYGGNANFNSYETNTTFNVEKQDITITYNPIEDVVCGENVIITGSVVDVTGKGLGNINAIIRINGKLYKAKTNSAGAFTFTTPMTEVGTYNVILSYAGNNNYNSYETSTTFKVLSAQ